MPASDPGLRRVSVHAGACVADLALPADVPVAVLVPSIVDILGGGGGLAGCQLSRPGAGALEPSRTLADNDVRDGAVLIVGPPPAPPPVIRHDDAALAVAATLAAAARPWGPHRTRLAGALAALCLTGTGVLSLLTKALTDNGLETAGVCASAGLLALFAAVIARRAYGDRVAGLALSLVAAAFAVGAGITAVPGPPGVPGVLLAASAAAATSVVAMRAAGDGAVALTTTSCVSILIAIAALTALITAAPLYAIGSVSALASLALLGAAARVSVMLAGLSPRLPPEPEAAESDAESTDPARRAIRADRWLTSLLAAFAASAAVGAIVTVLAGAPRPSCLALGALTGALLLMRSRGDDARRALVFVVAGMAVVTTTFGVAASGASGPGIATATATLAGAAMFFGFVAPAVPLSPAARRGIALLEWSALVAAVPLTCWVCGLDGVVRGLSLT